MGDWLGPAMVIRLVSIRTGLPAEEVEKVIKAFGEVVVENVDQGAKVHAMGVGFFERLDRKATVKRNPHNHEEKIEVPAHSKVVFRDTRKNRD